jgi:hypothetical protein
VIFVGAEARDFGQRYVPNGKHALCIAFPSTRTTFKADLPGLLAAFHGPKPNGLNQQAPGKAWCGPR